MTEFGEKYSLKDVTYYYTRRLKFLGTVSRILAFALGLCLGWIVEEVFMK